MITIALVVVLLTLLGYCLRKAILINRHWEQRGIKHFKPLPVFGNNLSWLIGKKSPTYIIEALVEKYPNEPIYGTYDFMTPRLFICDPEIIQNVLIKDFGHFTDHGIFELDFKKNPVDEQLFLINGTRWRAIRAKLTPIFTSGKLKEMFSTMTSVGENLLDYLNEREKEEIDVREMMGLFSMDVISSAVFGMDPGTLKQPNCEFRKMGKRLFDQNITNLVKMLFLFMCPKLFNRLGISMQDRKAVNYFCSIIQNAFDYRTKTNSQRNDFIQMMMQLKEKGQIEVQKWDASDDYLKSIDPEPILEKVELTDDLLMAQAQSFMIAGFEATALLMAFTVFEMTQHEEIQEKVREEVAEQVKRHGGLTYEALKNMKLLECSIKEAQRMYTFVPFLFRQCTKDYTMPNGFVIKKGDSLGVPIPFVHMNPNNFPDPKTYKPERFYDSIKPGTFLPFGDGPRMCIAMRYTMLVMKYGLAVFFLNYKAKLSPKTTVPLKFNYRSFVPFPTEKILLKIEKIS